MNKLPISVIILTFNEEKRVEGCLKSVCDWAKDIFIVDSYSTDNTLQIAKKYTDKIYQHYFDNYSAQRNWAQENLPIKTEWIFHLDADERVTIKLYEELKDIFSNPIDNVNGYLVSRRTIFMGKWIKHGGHYPVYHLRIFKRSMGKCENRRYDQHFIIQGRVLKLKGDIIDIFTSDLTTMIEKHNRWATIEARILLEDKGEGEVRANLFGSPIEQRRWLRSRLYYKLPLFLRAFLYFIYRYFLRLGFLDGTEGLIFHFLQCFWQHFLVDAKIYEYRKFK